MIDDLRNRPAAPALTAAQSRILGEIALYVEVTGEPCGGRYLARRLGLHHSTVQQQLERLHRQGWLRGPSSPSSPAIPRRR